MKTDIIEKYNKIKKKRFPNDDSISEGTQLLLFLQAKNILTKEDVDDIFEESENNCEKFLNQFIEEDKF